MTAGASDQSSHENLDPGLGSVAEELQRASNQLRQLAAELKAREAAHAEMWANYPHLKQAVYAALRKKFESELPPLPDKDLEEIAKEEGALPLEAFLDELKPSEGQ